MSEADWNDSAYYWLQSISPYLSEDKYPPDIQAKIDELMNSELKRIVTSFHNNEKVKELIANVDRNNVYGQLMLGAIEVVNLLNQGDRKKAALKRLEIFDVYERRMGERPFSSGRG